MFLLKHHEHLSIYIPPHNKRTHYLILQACILEFLHSIHLMLDCTVSGCGAQKWKTTLLISSCANDMKLNWDAPEICIEGNKNKLIYSDSMTADETSRRFQGHGKIETLRKCLIS